MTAALRQWSSEAGVTAPLPDVAEVGAEDVAQMAEAALIGAVLLLRGQEARAALDRVEVVDLADPKHRAIWTALHALRAAGLDPDPALVTPRLLSLGLVTPDRAGLVNAQIVDLIGACPTPAIWPVYAAAVLRESARRTVVEVCTRAMQATEGPDLATVVQVLTNGLDRVALAVSRAVGGDS